MISNSLWFPGRLALAATEAQLDGLESTTDFGWLLLETTLILVVVCVLAYLSIRLVARRAGSLGRGAGSQLEVLDRLVLEHRRSVYVVRAGSSTLLLGAGDSEVTLLCDLDSDEWTNLGDAVAKPRPFGRILEAVTKQRGSKQPPSEREPLTRETSVEDDS